MLFYPKPVPLTVSCRYPFCHGKLLLNNYPLSNVTSGFKPAGEFNKLFSKFQDHYNAVMSIWHSCAQCKKYFPTAEELKIHIGMYTLCFKTI